MTLTLIGLGLGDAKDITLKGKAAIEQADIIFLEHYTSILGCSERELEKEYGKPIILADRDIVEKRAEEILEPAKTKNVCFLVVGDPFGATTHADLYLRAKDAGIQVKVIHNASILNAVGIVGLELYKYGKTTSIVFPEEGWEVQTHYDAIKENLERGLHTLCLLDIKIKEARKEDLKQGRENPLKPRFMSVNEALRNLLSIEEKRQENIVTQDTLVVGVARIGQESQLIRAGTVKELLDTDFGAPLHSLIIPGKLHFIEEEMIEQWKQ